MVCEKTNKKELHWFSYLFQLNDIYYPISVSESVLIVFLVSYLVKNNY